ncbi:protein-export chaperone SecB [Paroceanicella profunda]|uniref:Protein-export protein SecB n=1 Tax=Paroceanicella profunda TaxID=2579971 RepID=A0A5B8FVV3_9RHOB|nr:protein-export chaperone SecB [Paroceanicella profunda]QDL91300.1 protein-export chaperone SecB [Paroceanicella profunda]
MAENDTPVQPRLQVVSQFIRDLSFENVAAQKSLNASEAKPEITVNVGLDAGKIGDDLYEVKMKVNIDATAEGNKIFVLEMEYAGRFVVQNVPEAQLHPFLLIECPRMIFPYVRRIIGDITRDGGYPPLNVDNIDFVNLYRQEVERRRAAQVEGPTSIS